MTTIPALARANAPYQSATAGDRVKKSKNGIRMKILAMLTTLDFMSIFFGQTMFAWLYLGNIRHETMFSFLPLLVPFYFLVAVRQQAYRLNVVISATRSTRRACLSLCVAALIVIAVTFVLKSTDNLSRMLTITGTTCGAVLLVVSRFLFSRYAFGLLDGSPESEVVLIDGVLPPDTCGAYKVDLRGLGIEPSIDDPVMLNRLGMLVCDADRVIVSCPPERRGDWSRALKGAGVNVEVLAPELDEIGAIHTTRYHGTATALIASGRLNAVDRLIKRLFDLAIAVPAAILLLPLFAIIAICIKLDSPGPILFVQQRIGQGNRMFPMFKFRSMRADQLDHKASKLTSRNDSRVTRIGRFIRKTSIDELPQLLNVLRGEMSVVGPRPHATGALAGDALYWEVTSQYWNRHAVKPGLTGLAQVKGFRGNTETHDDLLNRLQADLDYLDSWSIWRDVTIVFQTFGVLLHRNAF
ncbi:sugar transferase [Sphingomonas silueang]|jgi:lipopolysaccharide/colanic/teichoic acid biosynthesis glycosyltransferase